MPISNGVVTVGTTATEIPVTHFQPWTIDIRNNDNTDAVYLGGPGVTTANGMPLAKEQFLQLRLAPLDRVYAVSTKTGHSLAYVRHTQAS